MVSNVDNFFIKLAELYQTHVPKKGEFNSKLLKLY